MASGGGLPPFRRVETDLNKLGLVQPTADTSMEGLEHVTELLKVASVGGSPLKRTFLTPNVGIEKTPTATPHKVSRVLDLGAAAAASTSTTVLIGGESYTLEHPNNDERHIRFLTYELGKKNDYTQKYGIGARIADYNGLPLEEPICDADLLQLITPKFKKPPSHMVVNSVEYHDGWMACDFRNTKTQRMTGYVGIGPERLKNVLGELSDYAFDSKVAAELEQRLGEASKTIVLKLATLGDLPDEILQSIHSVGNIHNDAIWLYVLHDVYPWNAEQLTVLEALVDTHYYKSRTVDTTLLHPALATARIICDKVSQQHHADEQLLAKQYSPMIAMEKKFRETYAPSTYIPPRTSPARTRNPISKDGTINENVCDISGDGEEFLLDIDSFLNIDNDEWPTCDYQSDSFQKLLDQWMRRDPHDRRIISSFGDKKQDVGSLRSWLLAALLRSIGSGRVEAEGTHFLWKRCLRDEARPELNAWKIEYNVPVENSFDALTEIEDEVQFAYQSVEKPKDQRIYTKKRLPKQVPNMQRRQKAADKERAEKKIPNLDPPDQQVKNYESACRRLNSKAAELVKLGANSTARYILRRNGLISPMLAKTLVMNFDWLENSTIALEKGMLMWSAYCCFNKVMRYQALSGYVRDMYKKNGIPASTSIGWVRDLTTDGDVESNPGPIAAHCMKDVQEGHTITEILVNDFVKPHGPVQHWAHHRTCQYTNTSGLQDGDLAAIMVPYYNTQRQNNNFDDRTPLPLKEYHWYPRSLPAGPARGGEENPLPGVVHWRVGRGNHFPGAIQPHNRPFTPPGPGQAAPPPVVPPMPEDAEGAQAYRRRWRPTYGERLRIQVRVECPLEPSNWVPLRPDTVGFDDIWDLFEYQPVHREIGHFNANFGNEENTYHLTSGAPVLFIRAGNRFDNRIPRLQGTDKCRSALKTFHIQETIYSHRPQPVWNGYRKEDVELFAFTVYGMSDTEGFHDDQFLCRPRCDLTMPMCKLGLYMAWWATQPSNNREKTTLYGQTQALTPSIIVPQHEDYETRINHSINPNENCGGWENPGFPFLGVGGEQPVQMTGRIFFHLSRVTVPVNTTAIWIPDEFHEEKCMSTVALMVMILAPWPIGNFGMWLQLLNTVDDSRARCFYNWLGGLTHMPGETDIHLLWPRKDPGIIRNADDPAGWQAMCAYIPYAGPTQAGGTQPNQRYQVGGDSANQVPPAYNLVEFLLSWVGALRFNDFGDMISVFAKTGCLGNNWHNIFDVLPIWATRTARLFSRTDEPNGLPTADDFDNLLANDEAELHTLHVFGNAVPRLPAETNWLHFEPQRYDGLMNMPDIEGFSGLMGRFLCGNSGTVSHESVLLGMYTSTWSPMGLIAFRLISICAESLINYCRISVDAFSHWNANGFAHYEVRRVMTSFFVDANNPDPEYYYAFDKILAYVSNGSILASGANGLNLMRTITTPRLWVATVTSRDYAIQYSILPPVKYPDVYFQHVADLMLIDWAPFVAAQGGKCNWGLRPKNEKEISSSGAAGATMNIDTYPFRMTSRDIITIDGRSLWNIRLILINGTGTFVYRQNGQAVPNMIPAGQLPVLRPWSSDRYSVTGDHHHCQKWSNTVFAPVLEWNTLNVLIVESIPPVSWRDIRCVQSGAQSFQWYSWFMVNDFPIPLSSSPAEVMPPQTQEFYSVMRGCAKGKRHEDTEEPAIKPALTGTQTAAAPGNVEASNVEGGQ